MKKRLSRLVTIFLLSVVTFNAISFNAGYVYAAEEKRVEYSQGNDFTLKQFRALSKFTYDTKSKLAKKYVKPTECYALIYQAFDKPHEDEYRVIDAIEMVSEDNIVFTNDYEEADILITYNITYKLYRNVKGSYWYSSSYPGWYWLVYGNNVNIMAFDLKTGAKISSTTIINKPAENKNNSYLDFDIGDDYLYMTFPDLEKDKNFLKFIKAIVKL